MLALAGALAHESPAQPMGDFTCAVDTAQCEVETRGAPFTVGILLLGSAIASAPAAFSMQKHGRRPIFLSTCLIVAAGAGCSSASFGGGGAFCDCGAARTEVRHEEH